MRVALLLLSALQLRSIQDSGTIAERCATCRCMLGLACAVRQGAHFFSFSLAAGAKCWNTSAMLQQELQAPLAPLLLHVAQQGCATPGKVEGLH